jgi:hypothetical protein
MSVGKTKRRKVSHVWWCTTEVEGFRVQGQPRLQFEALSQKAKQKERRRAVGRGGTIDTDCRLDPLEDDLTPN